MFNLHNTWTRKLSGVVNPCSCSTMRVNWPPCSLKRKHIKLLSSVSVNVIWCWTRGPPAVLLLYCCSFSWRKMVICRGSVAPGQVSHSADAQAISLTPLGSRGHAWQRGMKGVCPLIYNPVVLRDTFSSGMVFVTEMGAKQSGVCYLLLTALA